MIMKPSCVGCHNSHPKSPRKDWQVGDVRGVIEIAQPLDKFILQNKNGLQNIFLTLLGISCLGILGMTLIVGKLRHINTELEIKVKNRTAELEFMATSDDLTQIYNRRSFKNLLNQEWQKMMQQSKPLSLIICDIDHFKLYNDRYGHLAGDNCLIEITQAIQNTLSPTEDFLARYGGEEFIVVLPNRTLESAIEAAELIRQSVVNRKIVHEASPTSDYVSWSLGVSCTTPSPLQSSSLLINMADKALYMANEKGRNCSVINKV